MSGERLLWGAAGAAAGAALVVPVGEAELAAGLLERCPRQSHGSRGARQREPREGAKQLLRHHHGRPRRLEPAAAAARPARRGKMTVGEPSESGAWRGLGPLGFEPWSALE